MKILTKISFVTCLQEIIDLLQNILIFKNINFKHISIKTSI